MSLGFVERCTPALIDCGMVLSPTAGSNTFSRRELRHRLGLKVTVGVIPHNGKKDASNSSSIDQSKNKPSQLGGFSIGE